MARSRGITFLTNITIIYRHIDLVTVIRKLPFIGMDSPVFSLRDSVVLVTLWNLTSIIRDDINDGVNSRHIV